MGIFCFSGSLPLCFAIVFVLFYVCLANKLSLSLSLQWARMTRLAAAYVPSHGAATALLVCRRTDCCYHKMMATRVLMLMLVTIVVVIINDVDAEATVRYNDYTCRKAYDTAYSCIVSGSV